MRISAEPSLLLGLLLQVPATTPRSRVREVDQPRSPQANETVAIVGATLIDGRGGAPVLDTAVVVQGVRILAVGRRSAVAIPPGAVRVDGAGMSVLPGLIDAHFHLDGDQGLPALYLRHGVTSVRDPGAWIEAYDAVRASKNDVPRLFLAGPHLDQPPPAYPDDAYLVRDTEETRAAVNRFID